MLHGLGIDTGVDLDQLVEIGRWICTVLRREPSSKVNRAMAAKKAQK
jgi:hydroxymethylglutaryl-CoA lyase